MRVLARVVPGATLEPARRSRATVLHDDPTRSKTGCKSFMSTKLTLHSRLAASCYRTHKGGPGFVVNDGAAMPLQAHETFVQLQTDDYAVRAADYAYAPCAALSPPLAAGAAVSCAPAETAARAKAVGF